MLFSVLPQAVTASTPYRARAGRQRTPEYEPGDDDWWEAMAKWCRDGCPAGGLCTSAMTAEPVTLVDAVTELMQQTAGGSAEDITPQQALKYADENPDVIRSELAKGTYALGIACAPLPRSATPRTMHAARRGTKP